MRVAWFAPLVVLYASYYWTAHHQGMAVQRFLIDTLPVVIGAAFALLGRLRLHPFNRFVLAALVAWLSLSPQVRTQSTQMRRVVSPPGLQAASATAKKVEPVLADGTAVFVQGIALRVIGFGRGIRVYAWNDLNAPRLASRLRTQHPAAPQQQPERRERLRQQLLEMESDPAALRHRWVAERLTAGRPVAVIVPARRARALSRELGPDFVSEPLLTWTLDDSPFERWEGRRSMRPVSGEWGLYAIRAATPAE